MKVGVIFPQTEIGPDVDDVKTYAVEVEKMGFTHILVYDHVLGADPAVHGEKDRPYDIHTEFHEPFVLFGYLAGVVSIELVNGILILPQRQTALVAKQAAEVDLISRGRFRLGVGVGWNPVEYEALGEDFSVRGQRIEEQVGLLRRLWTEPSLSAHGRFDTIIGAGIAPLPIQRPIPIWMGGSSTPAYERMGRLADGWFPMVQPGPKLDFALETIAASATDAGRSPKDLGMEGRVEWRGDLSEVVSRVEGWQQTEASHLTIGTMRAGLETVSDHLRVLEQTAGALGLS
jgi:probable F420-dependent oxidoreductase